MTFEGWKYQWCHELALMIDNDQELLRRMRELVGRIIDTDWVEPDWAVYALRRKIGHRLEIDHPGHNAPSDFDGWADLLEHYEAQVLEERRYEQAD